MIAKTPAPPYYAVIFSALQTDDVEGYGEMAQAMVALAFQQPGFLGVEHARDGLGITISYWADEASIANWKANTDHQLAQKLGREKWYSAMAIRVAKVERAYGFAVDPAAPKA